MDKKFLSEGAESRIYSQQIYGCDAVVKVRGPKKYRNEALDIELRKSRTRTEARVLNRLSQASINVPALIAVGEYSIIMQRLEGKLLKDLKVSSAIFSTIGKLLAEMHNKDVAHGDFTPANIMLCGKKVFVIDFGLAEITNSVEEKALDLLLIKRSISKPEYGCLAKVYEKHAEAATPVLKRLNAIEQRGRYQSRTLA